MKKRQILTFGQSGCKWIANSASFSAFWYWSKAAYACDLLLSNKWSIGAESKGINMLLLLQNQK